MIKKYSLLLLEKAIRQALLLDPSLPEKMIPLDGKRIKIIIQPLNCYFYIHFNQDHIYLIDETDALIDTTIESTPLGLIKLSLLPSTKVRSLFNDEVKLSGDVLLGQKVKQVFEGMDIDWEGHLARFTGDVAAYQLGQLFRKGISAHKQLHDTIKNNLTEYLHHEIHCFPSKEELDDFFNDVDELRFDVDRLFAQFNQQQDII